MMSRCIVMSMQHICTEREIWKKRQNAIFQSTTNNNVTQKHGELLTASLLRRSCSFLRAISLSFTESCGDGSCASLGEFAFCCSTSLGASEETSVQMLSGESGSSFTGCRLCSGLHGPGRLNGEHPCYLTVAIFYISYQACGEKYKHFTHPSICIQ